MALRPRIVDEVNKVKGKLLVMIPIIIPNQALTRPITVKLLINGPAIRGSLIMAP
jgi:hypothetical protein